MTDTLLTPRDVAELTGVSVRQVQLWTQRGEIRHIRLSDGGKIKRYKREHVDEMLARKEKRGTR